MINILYLYYLHSISMDTFTRWISLTYVYTSICGYASIRGSTRIHLMYACIFTVPIIYCILEWTSAPCALIIRNYYSILRMQRFITQKPISRYVIDVCLVLVNCFMITCNCDLYSTIVLLCMYVQYLVLYICTVTIFAAGESWNFTRRNWFWTIRPFSCWFPEIVRKVFPSVSSFHSWRMYQNVWKNSWTSTNF